MQVTIQVPIAIAIYAHDASIFDAEDAFGQGTSFAVGYARSAVARLGTTPEAIGEYMGEVYGYGMHRRDYNGMRGEPRVPYGWYTRDIGEDGFAIMPEPASYPEPEPEPEPEPFNPNLNLRMAAADAVWAMKYVREGHCAGDPAPLLQVYERSLNDALQAAYKALEIAYVEGPSCMD